MSGAVSALVGSVPAVAAEKKPRKPRAKKSDAAAAAGVLAGASAASAVVKEKRKRVLAPGPVSFTTKAGKAVSFVRGGGKKKEADVPSISA